MKISRLSVKETLKIQRARDVMQKGPQPEETLNCFFLLEREDTEYCEKECPNRCYENTCKSYLSAHEAELFTGQKRAFIKFYHA